MEEMVVVKEQEAWERTRASLGSFGQRRWVAVWLPVMGRLRGRRPKEAARCAEPNTRNLTLDVHLPAMLDLLDFLFLAFTLTLSLVATLGITVPLVGALVRLRGK